MKPNLYLITTDFPYGKGETSFILPELPSLEEKFHVTIISNSLSMNQTVQVEGADVIHYDRKASLPMKIWDSLNFFMSPAGYRELYAIIRSGKKIPGRLFESILFYEEARRFRRFLLKNRVIDWNTPAVIYSYWYTYYCYTMTELLKKRNKKNIKIITRTHRYDLYDEGTLFGRQPFKKDMDKQLDRVIFIAEHGRQYYLNKYCNNINSEKYQLFRLGVTPPEDENDIVPVRQKVFVLVSCSVVIPRKRVKLIIDTLSQISDFDIKWIHFGDGDDFEETVQYAERQLSDKRNIVYEFKGYVDSVQILKFYKENYVDAFITTSASEGCPVSVQEAMAYGIPIIGTSVADIPYMISGNGVLLSENPEIKEICDAIRFVHDASGDMTEKMRNQSYLLWKENYDGKTNARRFTHYLYDMLTS